MKKYLLNKLLTAALILLSVTSGLPPVPAYAEKSVSGDISSWLIQEGGIPDNDDIADYSTLDHSGSDPDYSRAAGMIEAAISGWNGGSSVKADITGCRIPSDKLPGLLSGVINDHSEYFYVNGTYSFTEDSDSNVKSLSIGIKDDCSVDSSSAFDKKVDEILSGVDAGWTDIQKAMYIHDYLVTHVKYDLTYKKYSAKNAILDGYAVCQGYELAYKHLINKLDSRMKCGSVISEALDHAWNYLTINNKEYFVDCTWDDPLAADNSGNSVYFYENYCMHSNFLRNRDGMVSTGHLSTDWKNDSGKNVYDSIRTGDDYKNAFWINTESPVPMIGNTGAYAVAPSYDSGSTAVQMYAFDFNTSTSKKLTEYQANWYMWGNENSWWGSGYTSLCSVGNYYTATTPVDILLINSSTGDKKTIYSLTAGERSKGYIYGAGIENGILTYHLHTSYFSNKTGEGTVDLSMYDNKGMRVVLDRPFVTISVNETVSLNATVCPVSTEDKTVTFTSDDEAIAKISDAGVITGISPGDTIITATARAGGKSAYCMVTVKQDDNCTVTFKKGNDVIHEETVTAGDMVKNIPPDPVGDTAFTGWYINNKTLWNRDIPVTGNMTLTSRFLPAAVSGNTSSGMDTSLQLSDGDKVYLTKGQKYTLNSDYSWTSSGPDILKIDDQNKASAKKGGKDIILTGESVSGNSGKITCNAFIADPILTKKSVILVGETKKLELSFGGAEEHYNVVWQSSNPSVVSVGDGVIYGCQKGSAKITAWVNGRKLTASVKVIEKENIKSINTKLITLQPLQTVSLKFADNFKIKKAEWNSSLSLNEIKNRSNKVAAYQNSVVRIGTNGKLTAVGPGNAVIVAETAAGEKKLMVKVPAPSLRTNYLMSGKNRSLSISNLKPKNVEWHSSADSVAGITNGKIIAGNTAGMATVSGNYNPYESVNGFDYTVRVYSENPFFRLIGAGELSPSGSSGTAYDLKIRKGSVCLIKGEGIYEPVIFVSKNNDEVFADESGVIYARSAGKSGTKLTAKIAGKNYTFNVTVTE